MSPTIERFREVLSCDVEAGVVTWLVSHGGVRVGDVAGTLHRTGYIYIGVDGRRELAHRLIWLFATGAWPKHYIDHINGDPSDNRLANLREATNSQNQANSRRSFANTSGLKGVCWDKANQRWMAQIKKDGRQIKLGRFDTREEAHAAYVAAARELHGEYARAA